MLLGLEIHLKSPDEKRSAAVSVWSYLSSGTSSKIKGYSHAFILFLAIWTDGLILQAGLDQVYREHHGDADYARDAAVYDFRQETKTNCFN